VGNGLRPIFVTQRVFEELDDLALRVRCLEQQLENGKGSGIEKVGVPRKRVEDDGRVVEVPDPEAVDGN